MGCLLCGKDIGPLRLLRDDEFCSSAHRNRYKERLGRALDSISRPEPPPAPVASFRTLLQPIDGKLSYRWLVSGFDQKIHDVEFHAECPVVVDPVLGGFVKALRGPDARNRDARFQSNADPIRQTSLLALTLELAPEEKPAAPAPAIPKVAARTVTEPIPAMAPLCASALAVPVESMVVWASADSVASGEARAPRNSLAIVAASAKPMPNPAAHFAPLPPSAVESLLTWSSARSILPEIRLPQMNLAVIAEQHVEETPELAGACASLPAVPVEAMVAWSSAGAIAAEAVLPGAPVISKAGHFFPRLAVPPQPNRIPSAAASLSSSLELLAEAVPQTPRLELTMVADAAAMPAEEPVEVVAMCEEWAPAPAAEPVTSMVAWSASDLLPWFAPLSSALPMRLRVNGTFVPASVRMARTPAAEPTLVHVFAIDAAQPITGASIVMRGTDPIFDLALDAASYVTGAQPEPVESMPAAQVFEPAAVSIAPVISLTDTPLPAAACSNRNTPARLAPVAVESFVFASFRAEMISTLELALPSLALEARAGFGEGRDQALDTDTLPAALPRDAASHPAVLQPIRTLALVQPQTPTPAPVLTVPDHGFLNLEFFCQRPSISVSRRLEWMLPQRGLIQPPFAMRPVFDKLEDAQPQKKASKKPAVAEIFALPEVKRKTSNPAVHYAIKAIAASVVMGGILWFGVGTMRIGNHTPAVNRDVSMIDSANETSADSSAPRPPNAPATEVPARKSAPGPVARFKKAISERAAATVTDSFRNGMEAWGTKPKAWAAGWSKHPEGYVQPGQLALFNPSVNYRDYHLEFFGQIDNKSMGWTIRSKDTKNYYAMKFTVIEPGLRPIIAMVHYPVVGGKKGHQSQAPLNVMVHNNTPFQVAVDVKGNRMVTSIDGQEVDTWIDDSIPAGGVGFFADAGEKARLYWMKVSKNEDFLGRVCAYVSSKLGDGSNTSAQLLPNEGSLPLPGLPSDGPREATLAAAVMGMRGLRDKQSSRVWKGRNRTWNS